MNKQDPTPAQLPEWQASVDERKSGDIKVLDAKTKKWVGHPEAAIIYADALKGFFIEQVHADGKRGSVFILHQDQDILIEKGK